MKKLRTILTLFLVGLIIQGGIYIYLDRVLLAPAADYQLTSTKEQEKMGFGVEPTGKTYYSHDKQYMAIIGDDKVSIYEAGKKGEPLIMPLKGKEISYFEWLPDRNLAILGLYGKNAKTDKYEVLMAQYNPQSPDHELDTTLTDVPRGSKIVDATYSTATNVVYMKLEMEKNVFRIYRTDANYDTRRIRVQAENIGHIGVFYDEDKMFYDNLRTGVVYMFNGDDDSWRIVSPAGGHFRLVGLDGKDIYIAELNKNDEVVAAYKGKLKVGFTKIASYQTAVTFDTLSMDKLKSAANGEK